MKTVKYINKSFTLSGINDYMEYFGKDVRFENLEDAAEYLMNNIPEDVVHRTVNINHDFFVVVIDKYDIDPETNEVVKHAKEN